MAKSRSQYICNECGQISAQWVGRCPQCKAWSSFVEQRVSSPVSAAHERRGAGWTQEGGKAMLRPLTEVVSGSLDRFSSGDGELDRVLGGGLVPGSVVLLGGEPGIGKSTLMLQAALSLAAAGKRVLYVGGEESPEQVRMRAERLGSVVEGIWILPETQTPVVLDVLREQLPDVVVVDSIQTLFHPQVESAPGSVTQIRESASALTAFAKQSQIPMLLVGHITKEGSLAGPKVLEHMVDVVLQFEGERHHAYRMLRAVKNRFGTTGELGLYEMHGVGLVAVDQPSEVLLGAEGDEGSSGSAIGIALEGVRPMLVEVQALVSTAVYGTPQRSGTGFDLRRLNMLLAVLEKRCGFKLAAKDVFLNMAGGLRFQDPALDLAVVVAILSSALDVPLPAGTAFAGEVGLSGEIRPVPRMSQRVSEAKRMGMNRIFVSGHAKWEGAAPAGLEWIPIYRVGELHGSVF